MPVTGHHHAPEPLAWFHGNPCCMADAEIALGSAMRDTFRGASQAVGRDELSRCIQGEIFLGPA